MTILFWVFALIVLTSFSVAVVAWMLSGGASRREAESLGRAQASASYFFAVSSAVLLTLAVLGGCATVKHVARTINDAADIACTLFAADHEAELQGLSPRQWCDIKRNFDPFLEEILQAQRAAGAKAGISSGGEAE